MGKPTTQPRPLGREGPVFLEQTRALVIYLSIYPATHLFIFNSNIFSSGGTREGKKSEIDTGSFSNRAAACGLRVRMSDLLPGRGCPGSFWSVFCHPSPLQASHLRPLPHQGKLQDHNASAIGNTHVLQSINLTQSVQLVQAIAGQLAEFLCWNAPCPGMW